MSAYNLSYELTSLFTLSCLHSSAGKSQDWYCSEDHKSDVSVETFQKHNMMDAVTPRTISAAGQWTTSEDDEDARRVLMNDFIH